MFSIAITFGPAASMWVLMYKTEENAQSAWTVLQGTPREATLVGYKTTPVEVIDDFGQTIRVNPDVISGMMLEDMHKSQLAHIERALHQARMQAKGSEMAANDHVLRNARAQQGPGIITPGIPGNGRFPM
jgi:hypothetical protein